MMIQGIAPGPQVMTEKPELFWGLIASMWIGNLMLVVLNLPLIGMWVKLLTVPYRFLYPVDPAVLCDRRVQPANNPSTSDHGASSACSATSSSSSSASRRRCPVGFILGPLMEENLRRAMLLSRGDPSVFFQRPISLGLLIATAVLLILMALPSIKKARQEAFQEEG